MAASEALFSPPKIAQVAVSCTDLEVAKRYYCDTLGLEFVGEINDSIFVRCGEVNLIIQKFDGRKPGHPIYFSADGCIEKATRDLKARGVVFTQEPRCIARAHEGVDVWLGFFEDPWGNKLALISNMPMAN